MRDKLVELIEEAAIQYLDAYANAGKIADFLIANGVTFADVPDTNVGKWIPVSERPPEDSGDVILCTRSRIVGVGFYDKMTRSWVQHYSGGGIRVDVTHWMPMPEPSKEGE
jgi:hypothetical protein